MTFEQLTHANQIKHQIDVIEKQIEILKDMEADERAPSIYHSEIGSVTLERDWCYELIGFAIDKYEEQRDKLYEEFNDL